MRERVLLAPGANESELRRSMALFGRQSLGLRIMNGPQLARYALMKAGIALTEEILGREEELALVGEALRGVSWFGGISLSDIRKVAATLREIRQIAADGEGAEAGIVSEALRKGPFPEKNKALYDVYEGYMARLRDEKRLDGIALMRKALAECPPVGTEILLLEEFPLSPLEALLAQKLSGGKEKRVALPELFEAEQKPLSVEVIRECYGIRAEAETLLCEVRDNRIALDACEAAVTDPVSYSQLFYDLHLQYCISVSFGCGIPMGNAAPAKLLQLYVGWTTKGFFGGEALQAMFDSETFDRKRLPESYREARMLKKADNRRMFMDVLYGLRLTNDADINARRLTDFEKALVPEDKERDYLPALKALAGELSLSPASFIRKYARLRPSQEDFPGSLLHRLDAAALSEITKELDLAQATGQGGDLSALAAKILVRNVCRESSRAGALHLCAIPEALSSPRENLYVLGLSAALYPGSPRENHLLLDADILAFPSDPKDYTSAGRVRRRQQNLRNLLRLSAALGSRIRLSYAGYDTAELKEANASSLLYGFYEESCRQKSDYEAFRGAVQKVGYFDHSLSEEREIGRAVIRGAGVSASEKAASDESESSVILGMDTAYSPSALSTFYQCPRHFYLRTLLGIQEPEEEKPFEIISAAEIGSMAHSLMERLGQEELSKEELLRRAGEAFDRFMAKNPPLTTHSLQREKEDFLELMGMAFDQDAAGIRTSVLLAEEDIEAVHQESGVKLHGLPDRVELTGGQEARIVDFKTGRQNKFVENDIDSCLQAVIYAFLVESKSGEREAPVRVQGGEFRLLRLGEKTAFDYDEAMRAALSKKLKSFREALEEGCFEPPVFAGKEGEKNEQEICRYCRFDSICGKQSRKEEDDEP